MSRLPSLKPADVIKALRRAGFVESHQTGSHLILEKPNHPLIISVPMHNRDLKKGTLRHIIEQAGLTRKEFLSLL